MSAHSSEDALVAACIAGACTTVSELVGNTSVSMQQDGNKAFKDGQYQRAIELYTQCIALDDSITAAYANRAMAALKAGQPEAALQDCEVVLQRDAGNLKCWLRKGQACCDLDRKDEAVAAWQKCLELQPGNAQAQELLAKADSVGQ